MIRPVTSPDNHYVKLAASLQQKKYREDTGLFVVEGVRSVEAALASSWSVEYAVTVADPDGDARLRQLLETLEGRGCPVLSVSQALFRKIADTEHPQGILAVFHQQRIQLSDLSPVSPTSCWVVLDSLQDPGNVGTMIRTADAAGAAGVLLSGHCADLYLGKTVRATMGSLFHLPVVRAAAGDCLDFFRRHGLTVYVAAAEAAALYSEADLRSGFAIVFGNEGAGVGSEFRAAAFRQIRIPILGRAESLNASAAAAVILYEAARQRGFALS